MHVLKLKSSHDVMFTSIYYVFSSSHFETYKVRFDVLKYQ